MFRESPEIIKADLKKRKYKDRLPLVDEIITLDIMWREQLKKRDELKQERNKVTKEIALSEVEETTTQNAIALFRLKVVHVTLKNCLSVVFLIMKVLL